MYWNTRQSGQFPELLNKTQRDFSRSAVSNQAAIDFRHRDDFRGGPRQKYLITYIEVVRRKKFFLHQKLKLIFGNFHDYISRNAFQGPRGGGGCNERVFFQNENVVAGALRDIAFTVEHDGLRRIVPRGFRLG